MPEEKKQRLKEYHINYRHAKKIDAKVFLTFDVLHCIKNGTKSIHFRRKLCQENYFS